MRKTILLLLIIVTAASTVWQFYPSKDTYLKTAKLPKQDRIDLAIQYEYEITKDPNLNSVPRERLLIAEQILEARLNTLRPNSAVTGITWQERGPNNVGGRTRALIFDLNDAANGYKKVWAGGVGGGLWYTNDITAAIPVWNKVNDFMENLAITSIAQNPANPQEIYVGTGEGWFNSDAIRGLGIWKTTNGGTTWTQLTSTNNSTFYFVQKIVVDATGKLYACTRDGGLQKSTNGGASWTKILGSGVAGGVHNNAADIEIASNGNLYSSFGIFSTGKIYRSTDEGASWTDITPVSARRIELACAPSDANIVYAVFHSATTNDCNAIQRYNASTNTWTACAVPTIIDQGSNSNFTRGQAWYDLVAAVDPNNANRIYIGGVDALRSDNGGASWTQMTTWAMFAATGFTIEQNVHADQHAIVYAPGSSSRAIWGTDGGVDYTANADIATPGKPTFVEKNNGYNVTQYYACAIHPTQTNYFLAGAQDNGTQKFTSAGINSTTNASGGDGAFCHIDQDNPNIQITSYVFNNYYISTNGGISFSSRSFANTGGFINPTDYDDDANILYGGNNAGSYFRWNDPATGGTSWSNVSCAAFSTASVRHVLVSKTVANRVYFGLSNGSVVMVNDANSGTSVAGTVIRTGTGSVSGIAIDPANENHMLVTYSNYGVTSVWESFNATSGAPTWTAVEGNLPDMPVRWVMFDPRNSDWALIATELGVWSTDNLNGSSTAWDPTNNGFANVRVDMLQYRASDKTIAAATHGRGLFTASVGIARTPPQLSAELQANGHIKLDWRTAAEINSTKFEVEKSYDGTNFGKIAEVNASGTKNSPTDYTYTDKENVQLNYYRIRMLHSDGHVMLSNIVDINNTNAPERPALLSNPFVNQIRVRFARVIQGNAVVSLYDASGKLVHQSTHSGTSSLMVIDVNTKSTAWARGIYLLEIVAEGKRHTFKVRRD
jgi:trimeric autotransporter adhesin